MASALFEGVREAPVPAPVDPEIVAVQADLARARERVAMSVRALREEVARRRDWREWIRRRPLSCLVGAFAVGLWLGRLSD